MFCLLLQEPFLIFNLNMMKKILLFFICVTFIKIVNAQEFHYGLFAGANLNTMKIGSDLYSGGIDNTDKLMTIGFRGGAFAEYSFNKNVGVQSELSFSQSGYRIINENINEAGNERFIYTNKQERIINDISLDLIFKWYLFNQRLAIDLGVQPSLTCSVRNVSEQSFSRDSLNINMSKQVLSETTTLMKRNEEYRSFNLSVIGGASYYIKKNVFVSARYIFGMTDIFTKEVGKFNENNEYIIERKNQLSRKRSLQLCLGWRF